MSANDSLKPPPDERWIGERQSAKKSVAVAQNAPRSPAQELLVKLLQRSYADVERDYRPCPFSRFELDIAFPSLQVGIEVDGWGFHGRFKADFYRDRSKRNFLTLNDWAVLSYPAKDISSRQDEVLHEIGLLIQQRTRRPAAPSLWPSFGLQKTPKTRKAG